eukprot:176619-Pleurochrysis_carterae.AAC.4
MHDIPRPLTPHASRRESSSSSCLDPLIPKRCYVLSPADQQPPACLPRVLSTSCGWWKTLGMVPAAIPSAHRTLCAFHLELGHGTNWAASQASELQPEGLV